MRQIGIWEPEMDIHLNHLKPVFGGCLEVGVCVCGFCCYCCIIFIWNKELNLLSDSCQWKERGEMHVEGHCSFRSLLGLKSIAKNSRRSSAVPLFSLTVQVSFVSVIENFEHINSKLKSCINFLQVTFCKCD